MEAILGALVPILFVVALLLERVFPARKLPRVRWWLPRCLLLFVVAALLNAVAPDLIARVLAGHTPLNLASLGGVLGGVVAFLATDIVSYGVHRLLHNVPLLWRWTHQMHHSAERVDVAGAAYFHPLDILVQIGATTFAVVMLGVSPDAAALAGLLGFVAGVFQHMNVRTPQWIGWIFQRPEAHSVHHARGVHAYNYGNFMLWDIVFRTFRNPATFTGPSGFWDGASNRIGAMLVGRDVGDPPRPERVDAMHFTTNLQGG